MNEEVDRGAGKKREGLLVVVSGPSGVGKTTVVDRLLEEPGFARAVTATTRLPREGEGERDGIDYVFLTRDEFRARVARGEFLEHAEVHGHLYGTPRRHVEEILAKGGICLLNVDVQGAASVRGLGEAALTVFLLPPDERELERRLRNRATECDEAVAARLAVAREELARQDEFDVRIVNDDLDRVAQEFGSRIKERESRRLEHDHGTDPQH